MISSSPFKFIWSSNAFDFFHIAQSKKPKNLYTLLREFCVFNTCISFIYTTTLIKFFDAIFAKQNIQEYFM